MDPKTIWLLQLCIGSIQVLILGLMTWVLKTLVAHEKQLFRLVSDRESEKRSISAVHHDFEIRLRTLEKRP